MKYKMGFFRRCYLIISNTVKGWYWKRKLRKRNAKKFDEFLSTYNNWDADYLYVFLRAFLSDIAAIKYTMELLSTKEKRKLYTCIVLAHRLYQGDYTKDKFKHKLRSKEQTEDGYIVTEIETIVLNDFPVSIKHVSGLRLREHDERMLFKLLSTQLKKWWN